MTEWRDYSITASANSTITVANGGWPESTMTLPDVNNAARAMQSLMKRWLLDHQGQQASVGTSSTADVALSQVISTANATVILQEGDRFLFKAGIGNTGAYNLSVRSGTAHQVLTTNSQALHQGMIQAGGFYDVRWEQSSSAFYLLNPSIDPHLYESAVEIGTAGSSVKINGTTNPDLSDEDAALVIGPGAAPHIEIGTDRIQAKSSATNFNDLIINNNGGRTNINAGANLAAVDTPNLTDALATLAVGAGSGIHLEMGGNDLQAKSDATTATTLDLNPLGGVLRFPTYAVASLPASGTPASLTGAVAIALDLSGGASIVINDGTNWVTVGAASGRGTAD